MNLKEDEKLEHYQIIGYPAFSFFKSRIEGRRERSNFRITNKWYMFLVNLHALNSDLVQRPVNMISLSNFAVNTVIRV